MVWFESREKIAKGKRAVLHPALSSAGLGLSTGAGLLTLAAAIKKTPEGYELSKKFRFTPKRIGIAALGALGAALGSYAAIQAITYAAHKHTGETETTPRAVLETLALSGSAGGIGYAISKAIKLKRAWIPALALGGLGALASSSAYIKQK